MRMKWIYQKLIDWKHVQSIEILLNSLSFLRHFRKTKRSNPISEVQVNKNRKQTNNKHFAFRSPPYAFVSSGHALHTPFALYSVISSANLAIIAHFTQESENKSAHIEIAKTFQLTFTLNNECQTVSFTRLVHTLEPHLSICSIVGHCYWLFNIKGHFTTVKILQIWFESDLWGDSDRNVH